MSETNQDQLDNEPIVWVFLDPCFRCVFATMEAARQEAESFIRAQQWQAIEVNTYPTRNQIDYYGLVEGTTDVQYACVKAVRVKSKPHIWDQDTTS